MAKEEMEKDDMYRLVCERILNESWSNAERYKGEIEKILERGTIESERDVSLLLIASGAFMQRSTLISADNSRFDLDEFSLVPCGRGHNSCDDCQLIECDYFS